MGFPTKNDQHLGCEMGVPPFKETTIYSIIFPFFGSIGLGSCIFITGLLVTQPRRADSIAVAKRFKGYQHVHVFFHPENWGR